MQRLSPGLPAIVDALPLELGIGVVEIVASPRTAARAIAAPVGSERVLGVDRSATAIQQATAASRAEIDVGSLGFRRVAVEPFKVLPGEAPFDPAVAVRVGLLDERHPEVGEAAKRRIARALVPGGRVFIDGGAPLVAVLLDR